MTHWISRLARRLSDLYSLPTYDGAANERDADARRMCGELDAIRQRFNDHR